MNCYHHLSPQEREFIHVSLAQGFSKRRIARELGRSCSTISREIQRNGKQDTYSPHQAHVRYRRQRLHCRRRLRLVSHASLNDYVRLGLLNHWSPEQISGRIALDYPQDPSMRVGSSTIYRALYRGVLPHVSKLNLRRRGRSRIRGTQERRGHLRITHSIDERPADVQGRTTLGHWEGDTVCGKGHHGHIVTLVERQTAYLLAYPLPDRKAETVFSAICTTFDEIPSQARQSITFDQGKEFACAADLERALCLTTFFAHPHAPWERGLNENTNGLLREFFPKSMRLDDLTVDEVFEAAWMLNNRPRKRLAWLTPAEALNLALTPYPS